MCTVTGGLSGGGDRQFLSYSPSADMSDSLTRRQLWEKQVSRMIPTGRVVPAQVKSCTAARACAAPGTKASVCPADASPESRLTAIPKRTVPLSMAMEYCQGPKDTNEQELSSRLVCHRHTGNAKRPTCKSRDATNPRPRPGMSRTSKQQSTIWMCFR